MTKTAQEGLRGISIPSNMNLSSCRGYRQNQHSNLAHLHMDHHTRAHACNTHTVRYKHGRYTVLVGTLRVRLRRGTSHHSVTPSPLHSTLHSLQCHLILLITSHSHIDPHPQFLKLQSSYTHTHISLTPSPLTHTPHTCPHLGLLSLLDSGDLLGHH